MIPFQDYLDVFWTTGRKEVRLKRPAQFGRGPGNLQFKTQHPGSNNIQAAFLLFLLCAFLLSVELVCAEQVYILEGNGMRVLFEAPHEPVARELVDSYPELREELKRIFKWDLTLIPSVRLIRDSKQFQQLVDSPLTVAFAVPQEGLVVIDYSRMKAHPFSLRNTFKHELCHLLLHQHIKSDLLPRWLDEGVAQWSSDGAGDIVLDQKQSLLNRAALTGRFIPLGMLIEGFPRKDHDLVLAYEESKSFIEHLVGIFGTDGVLKVLNEMKQGSDVEGAFRKTYAVSLNDLEKEWVHSLRKRMTCITYLSYHLYDILFTLAALASIYGFIRVMAAKRRRMKEELEIEELKN